MPLYEYKCKNCGEVFEEIKSSFDSEQSICPNCEEPAPKVVTSFSLGGSKANSFNYGGGGCYGGG